MKNWYLFCEKPEVRAKKLEFPFYVGRTGCHLNLGEPAVPPVSFRLEAQDGDLYLVNENMSKPPLLDGTPVAGSAFLSPGEGHRVETGTAVLALSTKKKADPALLAPQEERYGFATDGVARGPVDAAGLHAAYQRGELRPDSLIWMWGEEGDVHEAKEWIEFDVPRGGGGGPSAVPAPVPAAAAEAPPGGRAARAKTVEETRAVAGETFACPYCRRVYGVGEAFAVSTSPGLLGDPVLGPAAQQRFLPSRFTLNGLALDAEEGICPESACPNCHMTLNPMLLDHEQAVLSVVGAPSAGKSFFLASAIWQCRQILPKRFGVSFTDLDPVANRWINEYEEKLFFEDEGGGELRKIEKTDVGESAVLKQVLIDGVAMQLPLPSFFRVRGGGKDEALVVYDSAGEHFQAGADTGGSLVTLNMLGADVLYFLYDPSADMRFGPYLDRGTGTARRRAQRQDTLLSEMAARIRRHTGDWGGGRLRTPLVFGISKADMLRKHLDLGANPYARLPDGRCALDLGVLKAISDATEAFVGGVAPEAVLTARELAEDVWFLPMSALGHNPMQEGVRPRDVKPAWAELPVVFTLARRGLVPTTGGET